MNPEIAIPLARIAVVIGGLLSLVPFLTLMERKVCAYIQDRIGPNRVGPWGLLQPMADGLKLLMKEEIIPDGADRFAFLLAPALVMIPPLATLAIIPFGSSVTLFGETIRLQVADLPIGVLFFLGVASLSVYGLALGGWSSGNKYSLMGGLRACAQLVSYELAMGLCLMGVVLVAGSLSTASIVGRQAGTLPLLWGWLPAWNIFLQPVGFAVFLVCAFAENNRLPFDLPEAEPELVGGYHTEYTGMRFGTFFLAEYASMITMSALLVTLYLGGYHLPGVTTRDLGPVLSGVVSILVFGAKVSAVLFLFIQARWTLPRFKYQSLMLFSWKGLLPLALANLAATAVVVVGRGH